MSLFVGAPFARVTCLFVLSGLLGMSCSSSRTSPSLDGMPGGGPDAQQDGENRPGLTWPAGVARVRPPASAVAVAATAEALAVAYLVRPSDVVDASAEATPDDRLMLQWLDGHLAPLGPAQELDRRPAMDTRAEPAVASNGTDALVCWSAQDDLRCFLVGRNSPASLFFATTGAHPTPAAFETGWAVAFQASTRGTGAAETKVLRLSGQGQTLGPGTSFPSDNDFPNAVPFVSTPSGFALLAGKDSLSLIRLTADLAMQGDPVDIKLLPWTFRSLAATDDEAALGLAVPYGNVLVHLRGQEVVSTQRRSCVGKGGCEVAVAWQGHAFAAAWWKGPDDFAFVPDLDQATVGQQEILGSGPQVLLVPLRDGMVAVTGDAR